MGQYCFARWRPSASVTLLAGGPATGLTGSQAANTPQWARCVTSCLGDTLSQHVT